MTVSVLYKTFRVVLFRVGGGSFVGDTGKFVMSALKLFATFKLNQFAFFGLR